MQIFIDTNVFFGDWFVRNANLRYLFHFANNEQHELLISRLVVQEVENLRRRELASALGATKKALSALDRLYGSVLMAPPNEASFSPYDFLQILKEKVENLTILEYEGISHSVVVDRALACKRPFLEGEKGYRDTLIWLSLLEHVKLNASHDEIAFITANTTDFFGSGSEDTFHSDLIADIGTLPGPVSINPFSSLAAFVDSTIDKHEHAIDHSKAEELFGDYIEHEGIEYIASLNEVAVRRLQSFLLSGTSTFANASGIAAEVLEGVEDLTILSTKELNHSEVYIVCQYNLRRVPITIFIPAHDYEQNLTAIEESNWFYETEVMGNTVMLRAVIRPYFTVSFIYNRQSGECNGFSVSEFRVR